MGIKQMDEIGGEYLLPTGIIDCDHEDVIQFALETVGARTKDPVEKAVKLYYAVRDQIWYDPYQPFHLPEHYRASNVLRNGRGFCIPKASLLCALGRVCMIPSRVGFANVRNHLATKEFIEFLGSDLFVYHGFTEFFLEEKWVRATPAFNIELCEKHKVAPLEFNGKEDSVFQEFSQEKKKFMEYLEYLGSYADIPVDLIVAGFKEAYGHDRVRRWIAVYEESGVIL